MKGYKDYMDGIHVSTELHSRIIKRINSPQRRPKRAYRLGAIAACAVLVMAAVWVIHPSTSFPFGKTVTDPSGPQSELALQGGTLHFSKLDKQMVHSDLHRIVGYFQEKIEDDLVRQIFGGEHPVSGAFFAEDSRAGYNKDGGLVDFYLVYSDGQERASITMSLIHPLPPSPELQVSTIHGTQVTAGYSQNGETLVYSASFQAEGADYLVEASSQGLLASMLDAILDENLDLSCITPTVIPEWHHQSLTLNQARGDQDFGKFVPSVTPQGFSFSSALRFRNQSSDLLSVNFAAGMNYVELTISRAISSDEARIVDISQLETYDISLYPIPWAESVPKELEDVVTRPVFRFQDITLDVLQARSYQVQEFGDTSGQRMNFSVISDGVVVEVRVKGSTPEDIFSTLQAIDGLR